MRVKIETFQHFHGRLRGAIGSSIIRGDWLVNNWPEAELWTNGAKADVMIYQKAYWSYHMKDFDGIKILDMCDPDWLKGECKLKELEEYIDGITCSTEELTKVISNLVDVPVRTIPDRIDFTQFPNKPKIHKGRAKTACWFGYMHNAEVVLNMIIQTLSEHDLSLVVISDRDFNPLDGYGVEITNIQYDIATAYDFIRDCDIVLNPVSNERNFRFKSNNKSLISWALGVPVAKSAEDLIALLDADVRNKEIEKRQKELKEKWDIKYSVEEYKKLIKEINAKKNIQNRSK